MASSCALAQCLTYKFISCLRTADMAELEEEARKILLNLASPGSLLTGPCPQPHGRCLTAVSPAQLEGQPCHAARTHL